MTAMVVHPGLQNSIDRLADAGPPFPVPPLMRGVGKAGMAPVAMLLVSQSRKHAGGCEEFPPTIMIA